MSEVCDISDNINTFFYKDCEEDAAYLVTWSCERGHRTESPLCVRHVASTRQDSAYKWCQECLYDGVSGSLVSIERVITL